MKLAMSSWSYHAAIKKKQVDYKEWIGICSELGLDGVEVLDMHVKETEPRPLGHLRRHVEDLGMHIVCASVSNDFGLPVKILREQSEKKVFEWIEAAVVLDAPVVRVFAGWPGFGKKPFYEKEKTKLWGEMIERLRRCCEEAEQADVVLGLENHNHGGFTSTIDDLEAILNEVDHPSLRVTLDTGDYLVDTAAINGYNAIERAAPHAAHMHAKLYNPDGVGSEPTHDWPRILDIMQKASYEGYLSVEYEGKEGPEVAVPRGVKFLQGCLRDFSAQNK